PHRHVRTVALCLPWRHRSRERGARTKDRSRERAEIATTTDAQRPRDREPQSMSRTDQGGSTVTTTSAPDSTAMGLERWAALGGCAFAFLYIVAFTTTGIDFDDTDRAVLAHYASGSARAKEMVAFFLIAAAALSLVVESFVTVNAKNPRNIIATWQQDLGFAARSDPIG